MMSGAAEARAENPFEHMANYLLELTGSNLKEYRAEKEKKRLEEVAYYTELQAKLDKELADLKAAEAARLPSAVTVVATSSAAKLPSAVTDVSTSSLVDLRSEITERTLNSINADDILSMCEAGAAKVDTPVDLIPFSSSSSKEEQSE